MKKGLTELVFILDRSGSMAGLESDTIGGFNSMLQKQKKVEGEALVTTVLFDDQYELLHDRTAIGQVEPMTDRQYFVRGSTALLDAIGRTISRMAANQQQMPESLRAEKVIFVITTDGLENASQEYSYDLLRSMIQKQKETWGWEFLFLGANMDAVAEAAKFGIVKERAVTYQNDSRGIQLNYQAVGAFLHEARVCSQPAGASWKAKIEQDVKARGRKKRCR